MIFGLSDSTDRSIFRLYTNLQSQAYSFALDIAFKWVYQ